MDVSKTRLIEKSLQMARFRVRYIEIYNEYTSTISANSEATILSYTVPSGYALEIFAIGIVPDLDASTNTSGLHKVYPRVDGVAWEDLEWAANWFYNSLPMGDPASLQPIKQISSPLTPGNLTLKVGEKSTFELRGVTLGTATQGTIKVKCLGYLLEKEDVQSIYGTDIGGFTGLPGSVKNTDLGLYAEVVINSSATGGDNKFTNILEKDIPNYKQIIVNAMGVKTHANADALRFYDERTNVYFPDREPYFVVKQGVHGWSFGSHLDYQPVKTLPNPIPSWVWTNTVLRLQLRDNGTAVPANSFVVQLYGLQRKVG